jgi:hypothetical protein
MFPVRSVSGLYIEVGSWSCEKREPGSLGWGQFGNPEEEEHPPLEAATKQRLVKTEKTIYVL